MFLGLDVVSWAAIMLAVGMIMFAWIDKRLHPDLNSRMSGAVVFAGALMIGALLR